MKESVLKYIFIAVAALLLFLMLISARDAGINCDEVLHYDHSITVWNYFATHGKDTSVLNTPVSLLKYYGQSYDNIVTGLIRVAGIDDVYGFRHLMGSLAGWLAIVITAIFAIWMTGYRSGILVLILFAVSPTFLGHSQSNLKDIPFALGYISSIFLIIKFISSGSKTGYRDIFLLTIAAAFTISIRAGGLLVLCYLFMFAFVWYSYQFIRKADVADGVVRKKLLQMTGITVAAWCLSIILWPYALQNPVKNVIESYKIMAHFPGTFMQIFEGRVEWSDFMPCYYLVKSMAITIPIVVNTGVILFLVFIRTVLQKDNATGWLFIVFTLLFPILFVIYEKSNLYSSWRQFLFVYPVIVIISCEGFSMLFDRFRGSKKITLFIAIIIVAMSLHPLRFMILNHRYSYIYYNELVGGLKGAYGNYETDYYYVSQTEAARWLINYLEAQKDTGDIRVKATYSVSWLFRKHPEVTTSYFRYEERSMSDWDYAIVANRYIPPFQLKNGTWPPGDAIHTVYADGVPVCAVLKRKSKNDFKGYKALQNNRYKEAEYYFEKAVVECRSDEMLYYNFASALYRDGQKEKADSIFRKGLEVNPGFCLINMYMGNIAAAEGRKTDAIDCYKKVIHSNRKYFEAYVELAKQVKSDDIKLAREYLRTCLRVNPHYRDAIAELADTYRSTDPDIARQYDDLLKSLK